MVKEDLQEIGSLTQWQDYQFLQFKTKIRDIHQINCQVLFLQIVR
jgi:hypothetical protein